ncbi:MAG: helix-turn-helix transcriptional regulator [Ruminococcaceae bacterium]|nr:helix-turn-helix transcriptional regulator [Oscillospiraceae bacterium]
MSFAQDALPRAGAPPQVVNNNLCATFSTHILLSQKGADMIYPEDLARRIKSLRRKKGLTQNTLSELMDVTPQAVSKWETGRALPDLSRLDELAAALDVEITELLWGRDHTAKNTSVRIDTDS